jgi:hypothetical protein
MPMPDGNFQAAVPQLNPHAFAPQMQPQMALLQQAALQQPMAMQMGPQQIQQQMSVPMPQTAQLQHPEHLAYAQQSVQNCFSPARACASYLPQQQQMQIPFPPELVRTCSSASDGSSPEDSPYMVNSPAAHQVMQPQPAGPAAFQQAPELAHMPGCVPALACGYAPQQFLVPMNFAPQMMQVQQPALQHVDAQPVAPAPLPHDDQDITDVPKCGQTEVSSGSTREDTGESSVDAVSDSDSTVLPQRPPVPQALADALCGISPDPSAAGFALEALVRLVGCYPVEDFALALYSAAEPNLAKTVADLVLRLQPMFAAGTQDELLGHRVWKLCEEDLPYIASDCPPDRSHGTVVLAAELFMRGIIALAAMKELFAILLFSESHPADHAVSLACHGFLRVGQVMDTSEVGMKMVEYLVLRLKEVKGLNLSIATRQSITDVVELRKHGWEPSRMGTGRENHSGQKKARAAARVRARNLIARVQDGVADPWAGLSNDARALTALLELAAARDRGAERALACVPDEFVDIFRIVATPATLPVVLALRS